VRALANPKIPSGENIGKVNIFSSLTNNVHPSSSLMQQIPGILWGKFLESHLKPAGYLREQ
jgi:hypothetical protein